MNMYKRALLTKEKKINLSIYDQCINILYGSDSDSYKDFYDDSEYYENEGYYPPSCH